MGRKKLKQEDIQRRISLALQALGKSWFAEASLVKESKMRLQSVRLEIERLVAAGLLDHDVVGRYAYYRLSERWKK